MKNELLNSAADSSAEDLIRAIQQFGCAEVHAKSLYEQTRAELDNGFVDDITDQLEKAGRYERFIMTCADLRRKAMKALYEMYESENSNRKVWCEVKHLAVASFCAYEAWLGSEDDPALLELAYDANRAFVEALTEFIGAEVTDCAACLGEYLKGDNNA